MSAPTRPSSYQRPRLPLPLIPLVDTKFRENGSQPPPNRTGYLSHHPALRFLCLFGLGLLACISSWHVRQSGILLRLRAIMICIQSGFSLRPCLFRSASLRIWCMSIRSLLPHTSHVSFHSLSPISDRRRG